MYTFTAHSLGGLTLFEAVGRFSPADVWALVGEKSRVATFTLAAGSDSHHRYGPSVVAAPFYTREERSGAPGAIISGQLRLEAAMRVLPPEHLRSLKYTGIPIAEVAAIQFVPFDRPIECHDSGEKKIPNVIEIPYEHDPTLNVDRFVQNYLITKNNDGVDLAPFEKERLVGSLLAFHGGKIDGSIAEHFGFVSQAVRTNLEVRWHYLSTKERQKMALTPPEAEWLDHLKERRRGDAVTAVLTDFKRCRVDRMEAAKVWPILERILRSAIDFRPDVLLHGKRQVYWDLASYAHIALRHVKGLQVAEGTTFPYRAEDLKMLIEKVLGHVGDEIKDHFEKNPRKVFFLAGRRSVFFNDDYYAFHIEGTGRLVNFHRCADRFTKGDEA